MFWLQPQPPKDTMNNVATTKLNQQANVLKPGLMGDTKKHNLLWCEETKSANFYEQDYLLTTLDALSF
jgi:hypothetical protein